MFHINHPIAQISSSLVSYWIPHSGSFTLGRRDRNRMDSYRVSMVDVPELLKLEAQEVRDSSSGVTSCIVMNHCEGHGKTQDMNVSVL